VQGRNLPPERWATRRGSEPPRFGQRALSFLRRQLVGRNPCGFDNINAPTGIRGYPTAGSPTIYGEFIVNVGHADSRRDKSNVYKLDRELCGQHIGLGNRAGVLAVVEIYVVSGV
jgi:hypothetical protein